MSSQKETFTFFGATGGCAAMALALALESDYNCVAMVRTPSKLHDMLEKEYRVPSLTLDSHLTLLQGDITNEVDIEAALTAGGHLPDKILYGVGAAPKLQASLFTPVTLDQPTLCTDGMNNLLSVLRNLHTKDTPLSALGKKPSIAAISTTSLNKIRDVPLAMIPFYRWVLAVPHEDKKAMEKALVEAAFEADSPIDGFTVVKSTLLTSGGMKGLDSVRAGWFWPDGREGVEKASGPEMGYSASRADVGNWTFNNVLLGNQWNGRCATLTY